MKNAPNKKSSSKSKKSKRKAPAKQAFIVSGLLNEIVYNSGRFRLKLSNGEQIMGKINKEHIDIEELRSLWGKRATVKGMVHFKIDGQPRFIKANTIQEYDTSDSIFNALPTSSDVNLSKIVEKRIRKMSSFDPIEFTGTWSKDKPIEDLLAQLD